MKFVANDHVSMIECWIILQTPTETAPAEEAAVPVEGDAAAEPAAETEAAPEPGEPEGEGAAEAVPTEDAPAEGYWSLCKYFDWS